jgi:regulator of sirC expression with transglutaminase-like and TPR domain
MHPWRSGADCDCRFWQSLLRSTSLKNVPLAISDMNDESNYVCDEHFLRLLARRNDADPTIVALEIARDAYPDLEFHKVLDWIDARAAELAGPVAQTRDEFELLELFGECLFRSHDLAGYDETFQLADSSYLNRVIETKNGIPISLSLLYMAVASRLGITLEGVSSPLHFLTRYDSTEGPLFLDAFNGGHIMRGPECVRWLAERTGLPRTQIKPALRATDTRTIAIRMLNNIRTVHLVKEDWPALWPVQHRLTALQPASYEERRNLAMIAMKTDHAGMAIDLFESILKTSPAEERPHIEVQLEQARGRVATWN